MPGRRGLIRSHFGSSRQLPKWHSVVARSISRRAYPPWLRKRGPTTSVVAASSSTPSSRGQMKKDTPTQEHCKKKGFFGAITSDFGDKKAMGCNHVTGTTPQRCAPPSRRARRRRWWRKSESSSAGSRAAAASRTTGEVRLAREGGPRQHSQPRGMPLYRERPRLLTPPAAHKWRGRRTCGACTECLSCPVHATRYEATWRGGIGAIIGVEAASRPEKQTKLRLLRAQMLWLGPDSRRRRLQLVDSPRLLCQAEAAKRTAAPSSRVLLCHIPL